MSDPLASRPTGRDWAFFLFISAYLIGEFLWRTIAVAHEAEMNSDKYVTIGLDALAVGALILTIKKLGAKARPLFWVALVAGVGLFALRSNGQSGWSTGHLAFELCPRNNLGDVECHCRDRITLSFLCP